MPVAPLAYLASASDKRRRAHAALEHWWERYAIFGLEEATGRPHPNRSRYACLAGGEAHAKCRLCRDYFLVSPLNL